MKKNQILGSTKSKYILIAVFIVLALLLTGIWLHHSLNEDTTVSECAQLVPTASPLVLPEERGTINFPTANLDFREKGRIAYGKYGFRKEITIKESTIISQSVSEDLALQDIYFGVFYDPSLSKPVVEVSMKKVLKNEQSAELGKPTPYPGVSSRIHTVLEPGTYYLAVYSTNAQENCTVMYESLQAIIETELELEDGQWGLFFSAGPEQKTYFKISVPAAGTIYVNRDYWQMTYDVQLCDVSKQTIQKATLEPLDEEKGHQKAKLTVPAAGVYYLRISYDTSPSVYANEIRYKFVQND